MKLPSPASFSQGCARIAAWAISGAWGFHESAAGLYNGNAWNASGEMPYWLSGGFFVPACPKTKPYRRLTLITLNYGDHAPVTAPKHGIIYRTEMKLRIIT
jgi:hypothetical protein